MSKIRHTFQNSTLSQLLSQIAVCQFLSIRDDLTLTRKGLLKEVKYRKLQFQTIIFRISIIIFSFYFLASSVITELEKQGESQAALPITDENDYVIALRLNRWPSYVFHYIQDEFPEDLFKLVQGTYNNSLIVTITLKDVNQFNSISRRLYCKDDLTKPFMNFQINLSIWSANHTRTVLTKAKITNGDYHSVFWKLKSQNKSTTITFTGKKLLRYPKKVKI